MEREDNFNTYLINFCGAIEVQAKNIDEAVSKFNEGNSRGNDCNITGVLQVTNEKEEIIDGNNSVNSELFYNINHN